jgi:hypothetical protein
MYGISLLARLPMEWSGQPSCPTAGDEAFDNRDPTPWRRIVPSGKTALRTVGRGVVPIVHNPSGMNGGNTEVTIWAGQMRQGGLPAICVKTGQPADTWVRRRFSTAPGWTNVLLVLCVLVLGILLYVVVRAIVSVKATGELPFARAVATRLRIFSSGGLIAVLLSVVGIVGGLAANSGVVTLLGVLLFVAGLVLLIAAGTMTPRAEVRVAPGSPNDRIVVLKRVHPAFAQAVMAQQQAAQQQMAAAPSWPASGS